MTEGPTESVARRGARLLWASVRTHPRPFVVSVCGATLYSMVAVGGTIILGRITDRVILPAFDKADGHVDNGTIAWAALALVVAALLRATGVIMRRYWGAQTYRNMQRTWFRRLTDRYLDEPLEFFLTRPAGQLLAHADSDAERVTAAIQPLPFSLGVIVIIFFATLNLAIVDPYVTLVALGLFPGLAILNKIYTVRVEEPASRSQAQVGRVAAVAHESFEGALIVKALGLHELEDRRLSHEADQLRQARLHVGRLRASFEPGIDALPSLGTVIVLAVGAWRVSQGALTTGDVVQAMALFGILAFPMRVVGFLLEELPRSVVAHDRLRTVLDDSSAHRTEPTHGVALPDGPLDLVVDDLRFEYVPGEPVLAGVSFSVEAGEVVALVGSTGCGKSTLCSLLARLVVPGSGSIRMGGHDLAQVDPASLRAAVALVFQESYLFADTVDANLRLATDATAADLERALHIAQATEIVRNLPAGDQQVIGERGVTLSGGQRQRLALARALLRQPRLLLLDDATSAVDPAIERRILDALREEVSTTTLIVAHRVATIRLADRVLYLDGGRIAGAGAHEDLLALPGYEALVRAYERAELQAIDD